MPVKDKTVERNYLSMMKKLVIEYELIKTKKHPRFRFVSDFYKANKLKRQNFIKYYNRYKYGNQENSLLPKKRGRKFGSMKYHPVIQNKIAELRKQGFGRYEILDLMLPKYGKYTPSATTIYNILKSKGLNRLDPKMIQTTKRKIIKEKVGELGHIDCHRLTRGIINHSNTQLYLLSLTDDYSRLALSIVIEDLKAITVSINTLKLLSIFYQAYGFKFQEILSDNGSEFGRKDTSQERKKDHPFERLLIENSITHRYTRPYRPQTNGKVERYWRAIEDELLREQVYGSREELDQEVFEYVIYYNHLRRHQGIENITPYEKLRLGSKEEEDKKAKDLSSK
jgi:transposase InsO family protein